MLADLINRFILEFSWPTQKSANQNSVGVCDGYRYNQFA
jgi:hypothetical protein